MLLRLFLLFAALIVPAVASAQVVQDGFVRPTDVPAYVEQFDGYQTGTTPNQLGDGKGAAEPSNSRGGTMPVIAWQLPDVPSTASGWTTNTISGVIITSGQVKFRTIANGSIINKDDPIRNFAQPGTSHWHCYAGSTSVNAYSTYASLRARANQAATGPPYKVASTIAGGPYNATGYWAPCFIKDNPFGDGKDYAVRYNHWIVYYEEATSQAGFLSRLARGLRYVFGTDMDDPDGSRVLREIYLANQAAPGRYTRGTSHGDKNDGFMGYECVTGTSTIIPVAAGHANSSGRSNYLKSASGADPWAGACTDGMRITAHAVAPMCYDGYNLWSPGGYKHFRYPINEMGVSGSTGCPDGWYRVPKLNISFNWYHNGFADYGNWRLSSDDLMQAKYDSLPLCNGTYSNAPCKVAAKTVANGESFHADWLNGWDDTIMYGNADLSVKGWLTTCLGVDGTGGKSCDSSSFRATTGTSGYYLSGGATDNAPDGTRVPQVVTTADQYDTNNRAHMWQIPDDPGSRTIHGGHSGGMAANDNLPPAANDNQLAGVLPIGFDLAKSGGAR
jgi:uncharacterized protein DUF1996